MDITNAVRVEATPGKDGWIVTVDGRPAAQPARLYIDGKRVDYVDGRIVVSDPTADDDGSTADGPSVRRIAL